MKNPNLPDAIWEQLNDRLWHATDIVGLQGILNDGCIQVSFGPRYRNSICRSLDSVCLFDFGSEALDQDDFMASNWHGWLGSEHRGRCAVWLEISRETTREFVLSPSALLQRFRQDNLRGRFFSGVESCHYGPISVDAIIGAIFIDRDRLSLFQRVSSASDSLLKAALDFIETLPPPPPEHPLAVAIRKLNLE